MVPWASRRRSAVSILILGGLTAGAAYGGRALWLQHHFRAAEEAQERRDFQTALVDLQPYLAAYPESGPAHFLAARSERRAGRLTEAEAHLDTCRRLRYRPDDVDLERVLIKVRQGEPDLEPYLRERVDQGHPDTLLILEVLIDHYLHNYCLADALGAMNQYLEHRPDDVAVLLGRAFVWERFFSWDEAERDYRQALALDPAHLEGRRRFAELLLTHRGTPDEAAAEYERLLQQGSDNPADQLGLARCRREGGRLDEARRLLTDLLARQSHFPGARTEMGRVAAAEGQTQEAITWLRQANAETPRDRVAATTLLNCLRLAGRDEEERVCRQTLDQLDADLKRMDELSQRALKHPYDADLRYELGILFLRNGEEAEGVRWLKLALERNPAHARARQALAKSVGKE